MFKFFISTKENMYRSKFISPPALLLFAVVIWMVNSFIPPYTFAQNNDDITEASLLALHNLERSRNNLKPLSINEKLTKSARAKAEQMLLTNCWSHSCPNNKSPWDFFLENGYDYIHAGENLAEGFISAERILQAWMNSHSHRENILKPEFEEVGFGIVSGNFQGKSNNTIVVVHFGSSADIPVVQEMNSSIIILEPKNGATLVSEPVRISGKAEFISNINIFLNGEDIGNIIAEGGVFTTSVRGLNQGDNEVLLVGNTNEKAEVSFLYQPTILVTSGINLSLSNTITLIIALFIAFLFLLDFIYITKHKILDQKFIYSHYHFSLLILLSFALLTGVGTGQINLAISI